MKLIRVSKGGENMLLANAQVVPILPVEDVERAKKFYTQKLGLKLKGENKERGELYFHCGGGTELTMYKRARTVAEHTVAGFRVDDVEKTVEELRKEGVKFEDYDMPGLKTEDGIATWGDFKAAWFTDPEGNILVISNM